MNPDSIILELAAPARALACASVYRETRSHSLSYLPEIHSKTDDEHFFQDRVFPEDTVWVALDENRTVVGFVAFGEGWVNHLYVLPEFQSRGIGRRLLEIAKQDATSLKLLTFERNTHARHFFERHGFTVVHHTDGADNEELEPDLLMEWRRPVD